MSWCVSLVMVLASASVALRALIPAMHAQASAPPVGADLERRDHGDGLPARCRHRFYRGTRFDWSGVIGRLEYRGHTFYAPWFTKTDPAVRDFVYDGTDITAGPQTAITGPAEEFSTNGQGLGYADAAPGGTFVKIGVGVLRKPADGSAYSAFRSYDMVDPGKRTVATRPDAVEFTHELADTSSGYGYVYTKARAPRPRPPRARDRPSPREPRHASPSSAPSTTTTFSCSTARRRDPTS